MKKNIWKKNCGEKFTKEGTNIFKKSDLYDN